MPRRHVRVEAEAAASTAEDAEPEAEEQDDGERTPRVRTFEPGWGFE